MPPQPQGSEGQKGCLFMERAEEVLIDLFNGLRGELRGEPDVGLALKAQGSGFTLRVRSEATVGDGRLPYFAVVVGRAERHGAFRVSYKPSGAAPAERQVTIVDADSAEKLSVLVRGYVETERQRLIDYRRAT
jgi:hypothetical protein